MKMYKSGSGKGPYLLEVLREKNILCIRVYMEYNQALAQFGLTRVKDDTSHHQTPVGKMLDAAFLADSDVDVLTAGPSTLIHNRCLFPIQDTRFGVDKPGFDRFVWIGDHVIDLDALHASRFWDDFTVLLGLIGRPSQVSYSLKLLHNRFAHTVNTKTDTEHMNISADMQTLFDMFIVSKDASIEDLILNITVPMYGVFGMELEAYDGLFDFSADTAPLTIVADKSMPPDSTMTCELALEIPPALAKFDLDVHLKSDSGYLPKTVVRTVNGVAKFKIMSLGLDTGDSITVKAGFKNVSGLASTVVKIV